MNRQTLTPALKALAQLFMRMDGYAAAGCLHIWFADPNYEQNHAAFCAGTAWTHWSLESHGKEYVRLGYYLARIGALYLTTTQRARLAQIAWETP